MENLQLRKFVAPEYVFGVGARSLAGRYAKQLGGRRVLLVSDPGVIAAGWVGDVTASLDVAGVPWNLFSSVSPNPRAEEVMAGAEFYSRMGCNALVAVGGGSVIDCAKGIGIVSTNHRHILSFEGVDRVVVPMPILICIPTTGGTAADVSQFAIITDRAERVKIAIVSKSVVPDLALIDPMTLTSMDAWLTACTGMDALTHAIEAFVSNAHSPMTDLHALEAIRLVSTYLVDSVHSLQNIELRSQIMQASLQAGLAFSNAILGATHAMAHSLGGYLDLPHGECNALLLDNVVDFNYASASERFDLISSAMGLDVRGLDSKQRKQLLTSRIRELRQAVGIDRRLGEIGVGSSDLPVLSSKALKDACLLTNPRPANRRDIEVIYGESL